VYTLGPSAERHELSRGLFYSGVEPSQRDSMKISTSLPPPRVLTDEDYAQAREEARALHKALDKATRGMESFTSDDLKVIIRRLV
jgi:hypothetical protein